MRKSPKAESVLAQFALAKKERMTWDSLFQLCAEYVMTRKQWFTGERAQAEIQTDHLYDDTASIANHTMAAALIGALWPNGAKSFRVEMPTGMEEELGDETEEVKNYYQFVTRTMVEVMDNPKAGLQTALEEHMLDQGGFGTSGIMVDDGDDYTTPLFYRALDAKKLYIEEGKNGFVDTIYVLTRMTLHQLVAEYGLDNIAAERRKMYLDGKHGEEKVEVLQAIAPRIDANPYKYGVQDMPFASIHIDVGMTKIMRESGMLELPCAIARFWKSMGETYGRCPAMNALPSIFEANALGEAWTLAVEKTLDPALLVMDDGTMGSGTIDTSPRGITVVSVSGRMSSSQPPIQPLFLVGDLQWTAVRRNELAEIIRQHWMLDKLATLDSEQRMQNPEFFYRAKMAGQVAGPVYSRQYAELFTPLIEITFNKLRRKGLLGVAPGSPQEQELLSRGIIPRYIPEAVLRRMLSGQEVYKINFISPATRIMQAEELQGIEHLLTTSANLAPLHPSILDHINWEWTMRRVQELDGAPKEAIVSFERLKQIQQQKAEQQQQMMELEAQRSQSETARNMGQAVSSISGTGEAA